jgi:hypothetical protein
MTRPTTRTDEIAQYYYQWHHDEPTCEQGYQNCYERRDDDNDNGKGRTRTDENAHHYYFTERLPRINLTRVGMPAEISPMRASPLAGTDDDDENG